MKAVASACAVLCLVTLSATSSAGREVAREDLQRECERLHGELDRELGRRAWYTRVTAETHHPAALILPEDRDPLDVILRRTRALLDDLRNGSDDPPWSHYEHELQTLQREAEAVSVEDRVTRRALFDRGCALRRRIAFSNPRLTFNRILFVKRNFPPLNHMCDQFFGCFARPGGGLFVLENPFGDEPTTSNLLQDPTVTHGGANVSWFLPDRLVGKRLEGGAFLSPTLSYDGKTVVFAYSECGLETDNPAPRQWFKTADWTPELSYHLFKVGVDGSGLTQLTDGPWNDIHPFWMPDGRIVFISERRGGFGRCHARPVPVYTLHAMDDTGGRIERLSHHESNEWYPSVNHDGMIVYTRWDYVDRGFNQAHHPWITTPDGRDPRIIQGNYKERHDDAPNMEMNVLAIPGSNKYLAVAAAHHELTFGSLITIDPSIPDDDALSAVRRVTPDNGFPETAENGRLKYGTPWPLSENYYLCSIDDGTGLGLYLLDAFGNRELLYRDPRFHCTTPLPLAARPVPPIVPALGEPVRLIERPLFSRFGDEHPIDPTCRGMTEPAVVSLVNVYDSFLPFPEGTRIEALRVIHLLPKSVSNHHDPQIGYGCETGGRTVLGTVPVESDGSAQFHLPPGRSVYFQALDERGLAVQSMRSATYVHGGETLVCAGCHEPKSRSPFATPTNVPLALRRAPSAIAPEVPGSHPFGFPRLVQPVLDKYCVDCHQKEPAAISLERGDWPSDPFRWYVSYRNLHSFAFHYGAPVQTGYDAWAPARTVPGQFGARASKLLKILDAGHYDVRIPPQELRRITLWLDANSDFFGPYESIDAQADGQVVHISIQ